MDVHVCMYVLLLYMCTLSDAHCMYMYTHTYSNKIEDVLVYVHVHISLLLLSYFDKLIQ